MFSCSIFMIAGSLVIRLGQEFVPSPLPLCPKCPICDMIPACQPCLPKIVADRWWFPMFRRCMTNPGGPIYLWCREVPDCIGDVLGSVEPPESADSPTVAPGCGVKFCTDAWCRSFDFDGDGDIDLADLARMLNGELR